MNHFKLQSTYLLPLVSLFFLTSGCATVPDSSRTFHVLGEESLRSEMKLMGAELRILLDIYLGDNLPEPERNETTLASLNKIDSIAEGLGGGDKITNYSVINDYMGAFLYDVGIAKDFATRNPPNYFPSGTLIKSCLSCHESF